MDMTPCQQCETLCLLLSATRNADFITYPRTRHPVSNEKRCVSNGCRGHGALSATRNAAFFTCGGHDRGLDALSATRNAAFSAAPSVAFSRCPASFSKCCAFSPVHGHDALSATRNATFSCQQLETLHFATQNAADQSHLLACPKRESSLF
jgi:hypothetical protein